MQTKIKYKMTNREKRENRWGILFMSSLYSGFLIFALLSDGSQSGIEFYKF